MINVIPELTNLRTGSLIHGDKLSADICQAAIAEIKQLNEKGEVLHAEHRATLSQIERLKETIKGVCRSNQSNIELAGDRGRRVEFVLKQIERLKADKERLLDNLRTIRDYSGDLNKSHIGMRQFWQRTVDEIHSMAEESIDAMREVGDGDGAS